MTVKIFYGDIVVFTLAAAVAWRVPSITSVTVAAVAVLAIRYFPPTMAGFRGYRRGDTILYIRPGKSAIDLLRLSTAIYVAARAAAEAEDASKFASLMDSRRPVTVRLSRADLPEWGCDNLVGQNPANNEEEDGCAAPC